MKKILLIAGTHGVEPQSRDFAEIFYRENPQTQILFINKALEKKGIMSNTAFFKLDPNKEILVIPDLNPSGLERHTRGNSNGVDLNRNMPSKNWQESSPKLASGEINPYYSGPEPASELENKILLEVIKNNDFNLIISLHTNHFVANPNPPQVNYDGKRDSDNYQFAAELATAMDLPLTEDIGYPTPGSLGSYCKDLGLDCITIEFEDELSGQELWNKYGSCFVKLV
jgi:protein MpaA